MKQLKLFHHTSIAPYNYCRGCWSEPEPPAARAVDMLLDDPFSAGGESPHLPSDSKGSNTWTPPSVRPIANWFGLLGCAAITSGYTFALQKIGIYSMYENITCQFYLAR